MRILIVGGGIAGLSFMACLKKKGIDATLIEQAPAFGTIGYVIGLFPPGMHVLAHLGLDKELIEKSELLDHYALRDMRGRPIWQYATKELESGPSLELERSMLQQALVKANAGGDIRLNTKVARFNETESGVEVTFTDGKKETFDLVVGADGIKSQVRDIVNPSATQIYTGFTYWMEWVPMNPATAQSIINFVGDGRLVGVFPSKSEKGMMAFFGASAEEHSYTGPDVSLRELFKDFRDADPAIAAVLDSTPETSTALFHHDDDELHSRVWHKGRFVLIGDAVHAFSPLLGMGASMAMEDSFILADELSKSSDLKVALPSYEKRAYSRVKDLIRYSILFHKLITTRGFLGAWLEPYIFSWFGGPRFMKAIKRLSQNRP